MKKIDFYKGNKHYSLIVNQIKYLCGPNYSLKYELMNMLRQVMNKVDISENQIEHYGNIRVTIDDSSIKKDVILYEINQFYDLMNDLKMQSKSFISKYFETYLNQNHQFDNFYTIKCLFETISLEMNELSSNLKIDFVELTNKQLIKLMLPYLMIEENRSNQYDFNYEDLILFQLRLIRYIAEKNPIKNYIVIVDIPVITNKINENLIRLENVMTFVLTDNALNVNDITEFSLFYSNIIDFADEQFIFDNIYEQLPIYLELEEVYNLMKLIIKKEYNERTNIIIDIIK